jgi:hypothetical protein
MMPAERGAYPRLTVVYSDDSANVWEVACRHPIPRLERAGWVMCDNAVAIGAGIDDNVPFGLIVFKKKPAIVTIDANARHKHSDIKLVADFDLADIDHFNPRGMRRRLETEATRSPLR